MADARAFALAIAAPTAAAAMTSAVAAGSKDDQPVWPGGAAIAKLARPMQGGK
jgi:hypothetical protein